MRIKFFALIGALLVTLTFAGCAQKNQPVSGEPLPSSTDIIVDDSIGTVTQDSFCGALTLDEIAPYVGLKAGDDPRLVSLDNNPMPGGRFTCTFYNSQDVANNVTGPKLRIEYEYNLDSKGNSIFNCQGLDELNDVGVLMQKHGWCFVASLHNTKLSRNQTIAALTTLLRKMLAGFEPE